MTATDEAFSLARSGDPRAFAEWVRRVELPLRASLRRFARHADVEAVVQEALLRMWRLAPTVALEGQNASLRYAIRIARNLALREIERTRSEERLDPDELADDPRLAVEPDPPPDPGLRRAIVDCIARLPRRTREALMARVTGKGREPDRALAARLEMRLNTFLQNVVRARRHLARCLEGRGIVLRGLAP